MAVENRKDKFKRLSEARRGRVIESLRLLENCSNTSNYSYDSDDIDEIFDEIEAAVKSARNTFHENIPKNNQHKYSYKKHLTDFKHSFEREYTWINGFLRNVDRYPDKEALFVPEKGKSFSYTELNTECNRFANAAANIGVSKGDVIMFQLLNCTEFVFAYLASHKLRAVACPINYRLSAYEIAQNIDDSKPKIFIFDTSNNDNVMLALNYSSHKPDIVINVDYDHIAPYSDKTVSYDDFVKDSSGENPVLDYETSIFDETTRLYTSGTTGKQKAVCLTSINEVLSAHDVMMHFPLSCTDKTMNTTPWFHRGGLHSGGITPTLYAGGSVVIMRKFSADLTLKYTEHYKISFIIGVPSTLESLCVSQEKNAYDLSSLNGIVTMGSPLERAACIKFQKILTPKIFNGYGTTETFWNTFLRPIDLPEMAGSAGSSCCDDDVRVVKIYEDRIASPNDLAAQNETEIGEVVIKSLAKSALFYVGNENDTESKFKDGFMYTGDLATWDKNRFITICGRKDDMIISSGENIYPIQVEEVINMHNKVLDCIVTSVPDVARGEIVTAYVIRKDDSLSASDLDEFLKDSPRLSNYKRPRYYRFVQAIPVNATGKKLHRKMKELAKSDLLNGFLVRV